MLIVGWARVGALSVAGFASAAKAAVTPAELTPRHSSTAMVSTREISRIGLSAPLLVSMTVGSSANGTANPPADPVSDMARSASTWPTARTASTSAGLKRRCPCIGSISSFPNAVS